MQRTGSGVKVEETRQRIEKKTIVRRRVLALKPSNVAQGERSRRSLNPGTSRKKRTRKAVAAAASLARGDELRSREADQ